tara:strand:+ start:54507 stop:55106 length:600 start_codon:yes stop_codon:yes gene_type:complete
MALVAGFVFGYALPEFSSAKEGMSLQEFIESKQSLYFAMLAGLIFIQVLDLIVSYTFYKFFLQQHRKMAAISGGLRFLYSLIFIFASLFLFKNLTDNTVYDEWILSNIQFFHNIWTFGLIIFGIHILLLGYLMKLYGGIHKILWLLALIAGISYSLVSTLKLLEFEPEFTENLEMILALPMTVGELGLAIWMVVKGGKN